MPDTEPTEPPRHTGSFVGFFVLKMFVYFERERERERSRSRSSRGGGEREKIPSRFCIVITEPYAGLDLRNP